MPCSFDQRYFASNDFDVCYEDIYPVGPPFILKKLARGFVLTYTFKGILLKEIEKTFFFTMRLKRRIQMSYAFSGALLRNQRTADLLFSGTNLLKREVAFEMGTPLIIDAESTYKELSQTKEVLNKVQQELDETKEVYEILNTLDTLESL